MFTDHEITPEEHSAYFQRALNDRTKRYMICSDAAGVDYGLANLAGIDLDQGTAEWGFYRNDRRGKHVGTWLALLTLDLAFAQMGLEKVSAEVLESNTRSLNFHERMGFVREGTFRRHRAKGGERYDVHRFALFRRDWDVLRHHVLAHLTDTAQPVTMPLTVGHRTVQPITRSGEPSFLGLIPGIGDALEGLAPSGHSIRIDRITANRALGDASILDTQVALHVKRRHGASLTIAIEVKGELAAEPLLTGHADVTLVKEPA